MNFDDIARRTGLVRNGLRFIHEGTQQQFVLAPAGAFVMGMSAAEVKQALREVRYDPDVPFWRDAHARWYAAAQPLHVVTIQPFLVGRSPLLGAAAERAGVDWSTHETAEHRGKTAAAAMSDVTHQGVPGSGSSDMHRGSPAEGVRARATEASVRRRRRPCLDGRGRSR